MSLDNVIIRVCDRAFEALESVRRWSGRRNVETISTPQLQALLNQGNAAPVLVDVRSPAEQAVSRIPGSITRQQYESDTATTPNQPVVVYCTVGGRSYLYARQLVANGVDAANYRDGILGWCRAGLPLESPDNQATNAVHPYWRIFRVPEAYEVKM